MQFVLARTLQCRVSERMAGPDCSIRVTPVRTASAGTRTLPPLHPRTLGACGRPNPAWKIFDKYLRFVLPHYGPDWHPCSIRINDAREASVNAMDARALGITVAVEGLVNLAYSGVGRTSDAHKKAVEQLRKYVTEWPGFPDGEVGASLRARLPGLMGQLNNVGAGKRLEDLADTGVVERRLVHAWKKLRHPAAHSETPDPGKRQELADHVHAAGVLLNQLVFGAIRRHRLRGPLQRLFDARFSRQKLPARPAGRGRGGRRARRARRGRRLIRSPAGLAEPPRAGRGRPLPALSTTCYDPGNACLLPRNDIRRPRRTEPPSGV